MSTTIEQRLIELESRCAYQEETLQVLGNEVARQRQEIEQLDRRCRELQQRLASAGETLAPDSAQDNIPPHW